MLADAALFAAGKKLKVYNTCSTGTDHIDHKAAAVHGVRILCIKEDIGLLNTFTATAECAFMLLLACFRKFRSVNRCAHAGDWLGAGRRYEGRQLSGKTMGILGLGRLGKMTADYAKGFRMRVIGCDLLEINRPGVESVSFDELLAQSDAISIHVHMTHENHHLLNRSTFAKMKHGAVLINTSRGDVINEADLINALDAGQLSAFGSDVIHDEWRDDLEKSELLQYAKAHDNVIFSPHIGGATIETVAAARLFSAKKLAHYLEIGEELHQHEGE